MRKYFDKPFYMLMLWVMSGCTTSAPPLPADTTSQGHLAFLSRSDFSETDLSKDCSQIKAEQSANADRISNDNKVIESNRKQNEVAGYFGSLLLVPLVATESNSAEKDDIVSLQKRQDTLLKLASFKQCPAQ